MSAVFAEGDLPEQYWLHLLLASLRLGILQVCIRIVPPKILQPGHLYHRYLTSSELLCFCRDFDEPRKELTIMYDC